MQLKPKANFNVFLPLLLAVVLVIGMQIGFKMYEPFKGKVSSSGKDSTSNKLADIQEVFNYIDAKYVDDITSDALIEDVIQQALHDLDPHSSYIPASELGEVNEGLQGNFDGIGVEFSIVSDTIVVITAIAGGPSEKLGITAGDKIIKIEDTIVAGVKITNDKVTSRLRGERGTSVKISVYRQGVPDLMDFEITRDEIPIYSLDASYIMSNKVGYIKINRFSATTYNEFAEALYNLNEQGMERLILDLRQNPGGYLTAAVNMVDEFLPDDNLIVYTEGRKVKRKEYYSKRRGMFENGPLVILIDEGSASASEIVAGAIQDWDRGLIVGRRSFGKGLVQEQYELSNKAALRLTIARYYTPSGRSIQKPYVGNQDRESYDDEIKKRFDDGELFHPDSLKNMPDSLKFETKIEKRIVYGGGGIMPDVYVPLDTTNTTPMLLRARVLVPRYIYDYYSNHKTEFAQYSNGNTFDAFKNNFTVTPAMWNGFKTLVQKEVKKGYSETNLNQDKNDLQLMMKAYLARQLYKADRKSVV